MPKKKTPETKQTFEIQMHLPNCEMWATVYHDKALTPEKLILQAKTLAENTTYRVMNTTTGKIAWPVPEHKPKEK